MLRVNRMFTVLILAALILSACQPIQPVAPGQGDTPAAAALEPAPQPHQPRPDAPTYGMRGPYAVGVRDFVIEGAQEYSRSMTVSVWYPALNPSGAPEEITYQMDITPGGDYPPVPIYGRALQDAEPVREGAPFPLVLYSHGAWSFRQSAAYLVEHLASYGFTVFALDHVDNWGTLFQPTHAAEILRPIELRRTLDYAEALTAKGGALEGLIDMEHVAAAGWSFGGEEAMILAGARLNLDELFAGCAEMDNVFAGCEYPEVVNEMAQIAGLEAPPTGLWPDWRDPRVDVVVALAPGSEVLGKTGAQTMDRPILLMVGSLDDAVGPGLRYFDTHQQLSAARKIRVTIENASHIIFFNACAANPGVVDEGLYWVCSDPVWDMDRAHDLTNHFVTAFLLAELKGDAEAANALAPENAAFPGIQYETTTYATATSAAPTTGYAEVNGTRLYYEMAGAGDPVVLLHGFGADSRYWQAQFEALAENYQVIRYDLRGFGKSDLPGTAPYTHADDLKALMDYLGIARAHIIGHSFGGENAINFALAYPEATRSLILVDNDVQGAEGLPPSTPEEDAAWATIFAALEQGDRRAAAEAVLDRHPLFVVARTMPAARNLQVEMFADYSWWHLTGGEDPVLVPEVPAAQRLGEITAPTLVIIGELDNEYQHVMVDVAVQGILGAQKVEMPGLDHSPFMEDPVGFNQIVLAFLADK